MATQIVSRANGTSLHATDSNLDLLFFVEKIKKRYGHLGKIVRQKINRSNNSLGIALAGHRNRNEMGCFIVGVNPKGSVNLDQFNIGDELLEV